MRADEPEFIGGYAQEILIKLRAAEKQAVPNIDGPLAGI